MILSKKQRRRRSAIIAELSRLSKDGWANARPEDYQPLERELAALNGETPRPVKALRLRSLCI